MSMYVRQNRQRERKRERYEGDRVSCREGKTNKQNWKTYSTTLQFWMSLTKLRFNLCKFKSRGDSLAISRLIFAYMVRWHIWDDSAHHIVHGLVGVQYLVAPSTAACWLRHFFTRLWICIWHWCTRSSLHVKRIADCGETVGLPHCISELWVQFSNI